MEQLIGTDVKLSADVNGFKLYIKDKLGGWSLALDASALAVKKRIGVLNNAYVKDSKYQFPNIEVWSVDGADKS